MVVTRLFPVAAGVSTMFTAPEGLKFRRFVMSCATGIRLWFDDDPESEPSVNERFGVVSAGTCEYNFEQPFKYIHIVNSGTSSANVFFCVEEFATVEGEWN